MELGHRAQVPEVGAVEGNADRRAVAPNQRAHGAVAQWESLIPHRDGVAEMQAVRGRGQRGQDARRIGRRGEGWQRGAEAYCEGLTAGDATWGRVWRFADHGVSLNGPTIILFLPDRG